MTAQEKSTFTEAFCMCKFLHSLPSTLFPFKVQLIFIDASIDEDCYIPLKNNVRTLCKQ